MKSQAYLSTRIKLIVFSIALSLTTQSMEFSEFSLSNTNTTTTKLISKVLRKSDHTSSDSYDSCEIFCLQPDIRLCQCTKEELNKYLPQDMTESSDENKNTTISTKMPHIFMSSKEKKTCGEYSLIIRKLNIAMSRQISSNFYFEPTLDFQIDMPKDHSVSDLFFWGDWVALYMSNPYTDFDEYIPGCIWQLPSGSLSFHSTITIPECRSQIVRMLKNVKDEIKKVHMCVWSYERYWKDRNNGPCVCCEINFSDCLECFDCFRSNLDQLSDNDEQLNNCLLGDKSKKKEEEDYNEERSLSCYRCLNIKSPNYNCQSYEQYLSKLYSNYSAKIHNKYQILTKNQKKVLEFT